MDDLQKDAVNTAESEEKKDFVFIREEIKSRPLNKKKLARSTMISALSAVVFGLVACITFALVLPNISKMFEKEPEEVDKPAVVIFPEETEEEEMNPEDMLQTDEPEVIVVEPHIEEKDIQDIVENMDLGFTVDDYQTLYTQFSEITTNAYKSVVRVRTVVTEKDWFNNLLEEGEESTGLILANNGSKIYIVTYLNDLNTDEAIYVTFANESSYMAEVWNIDTRTNLCILSIDSKAIDQTTEESIEPAVLGSSIASKTLGSLVFAIGSPMGDFGSMNYGMITSYKSRLGITDFSYKRLTTNIYGSKAARGFLINTKGEVVGIVSPDYSDKNAENLISAIGITELKKTLENLINDIPLVYFGISGTDVPTEAVSVYGAPKGAFITAVEMDSPAMNAGIQAGDIVIEINGKSIANNLELVSAIRDMPIDQESTIVVGRLSQDSYKELTFTAIAKTLEIGEEE